MTYSTAAAPIITLRGIKPRRQTYSPDLTPKHMAAMTGIALPKLILLESLNLHKAIEPWLSEAFVICQVLRCDLMTAIGGTVNFLHEIDTGFDLQDDLDVWRTGVPLPLRFGIRLAQRFGLDDPFELYRCRPQMDRQIMDVLLTGERTDGTCPWCREPVVGGADHLDTCLPAILYQPRNAHLSTIGTAPKPNKPHVRRGGSRMAPGLAVLRARLGTTQEVMAASLGIVGTTYYRLEKLRDPLTLTLAEKISALYKVTLDEIYSA